MRLRSFYLLAAAGVLAVLALAGSAEALPANCSQTTSTTVTCTYSTPGAYTFTVPATGVNSVAVDAFGAAGGSGSAPGGWGGEAAATLSVTAGQQLTVTVGGAGGSSGAVSTYGGGGTSTRGAGGGGYSEVSAGSTPEVVAGGGGGAGADGFGATTSGTGGAGGAGGQYGANGSAGTASTAFGATLGGGSGGYAGGDGTNPGVGGAGGVATGPSTCATGTVLTTGAQGGTGTSLSGGNATAYGGGGGGGYVGGGSGGEGAYDQCNDNGGGGGGGGGSSYAAVAGATFSPGVQSSDGQVTITYVQSSSVCGTTLLTSFTMTANIDCSGWVGPALQIGQAGITLNLNGFKIIGNSTTAQTVIDNPSGYNGLTVENGTITALGGGTAIDNSAGGDGLVVSNMTITGSSGASDNPGINSSTSTGIAISGNTISGFRNSVYLGDGTMGAVVKGNTLTPYDSTGGGNCAGVRESYGTADMITGNTFMGPNADPAAVTCYGLWIQHSAGTVFSGNTATLLTAGIKSHNGSAGLMITGNVLGGATVSGTLGNDYGIVLNGDSGDVINGNYIRNNLSGGVIDTGSTNNTYTNNVLNNNGSYSSGNGPNVTINGAAVGPVTVVNNYSNSAGGAGFHITGTYNGIVPGGPYTLVSGNTALANGGNGFEAVDNVGATFMNNIAGVINYGNGGHGFDFYEPIRNTISNNSATNNGGDGFYFTDVVAPNGPLAVTNNSAMYQLAGWGFYAVSPVAGSGNTGGGTNGLGDCSLVSGCS